MGGRSASPRGDSAASGLAPGFLGVPDAELGRWFAGLESDRLPYPTRIGELRRGAQAPIADDARSSSGRGREDGTAAEVARGDGELHGEDAKPARLRVSLGWFRPWV